MSRPATRARRIWRQVGGDPAILAAEAGYRARRAAGLRAVRRGYPRLIARPPGSARFVALPIDLPPPGDAAGAEVALRAAADAAGRHEFDLLGSGPVDLGERIDWHRDFKGGYRWPRTFYLDLQVTRLDDDSDAKVPWELSRGHQLVALARAARAFGERGYAAELEAQWSSWLEENPPGIGINWANPMEVAIRAVNWVWALSTAPEGSLSPPLRARAVESLRAHGRHIAWNLEGTPRLRSNHFLADALGLLAISTVLAEGWSRRWRSRAAAAMRREIARQVHPDGFGFEASSGYHGLSLEMFLLAQALTGMRGGDFGREYRERLAAMAGASAALRGAAGRIPALGDGDSGRILPLTPDRPPSQDHLLWTAAALLELPRPPGEEGGEVAWTLGLSARRRAAAAPTLGPTGPARFPDGGVFVLAAGGSRAVVRCGGVGQNGNGGHAHNDALSFDLELDGEPLIVDPGTFAYTSDLAARNAGRSTRAHNTVQVDDQEINPIDPRRPFQLEAAARTWTEEWVPNPDGCRIVACHDGFRGAGGPIVHRRRLELGARRLRVHDTLTGSGSCRATSRFHLAPGTRVAAAEDGWVELVGRGSARAILRFAGAPAPRLSSGWVSDRFGARQEASVVELEFAGPLPLELDQSVERVG